MALRHSSNLIGNDNGIMMVRSLGAVDPPPSPESLTISSRGLSSLRPVTPPISSMGDKSSMGESIKFENLSLSNNSMKYSSIERTSTHKFEPLLEDKHIEVIEKAEKAERVDKAYKPPFTAIGMAPTLTEKEFSFSPSSMPVGGVSIEKLLADNGYKVQEMIIVKSGETFESPYSKAWTERGQMVFIELDMEGNIQSQETDLVRTESDKSIIPYDIRMGAYECGKKEASGVALIYGNEICTLTRKGSSPEPIECVLKTIGSTDEDIVSSPLAYPLVRMSDIMNNPRSTSSMIDRATSRMRASGYNECVERLHNIYDGMEQMSTAFGDLSKTIEDAHNGLKISILELEQVRSNYEKYPAKDEEEKVRQRRVDRELRARHTMLENLLRLCYRLNDYHQDTNTLTTNLLTLQRTISTDYKNVATTQMVPVTPRN